MMVLWDFKTYPQILILWDTRDFIETIPRLSGSYVAISNKELYKSLLRSEIPYSWSTFLRTLRIARMAEKKVSESEHKPDIGAVLIFIAHKKPLKCDNQNKQVNIASHLLLSNS